MTKQLQFFAFFAAAILLVACSGAKSPQNTEDSLSADTMKQADAILQRYTADGKLAGAAALVYKNGKLNYRKNFGFANVANQKRIENNTIYRIYSMTKPITAVALMTLYDQGKFQLDDKVADFIPEFASTQVYNSKTKTLEPQVNALTIRHLLTHTSGIPYGWDQKAYVDSLYRTLGAGGWDGTIGDKVKIMAQIPLKSQPGTRYEYGLGIDVAGYLVEVLSGTPLDVYLKKAIFDPLKMDDTGFYVPEDKHHRLSQVYARVKDTLVAPEQMNAAFKAPVTLFSGGGGLVSTLDDYLSFCQMLLNGGTLNGTQILKPETADLIMSNQLPEGVKYSEDKGYGLAGEVNMETGEYGWAGAASTKFWIDREDSMIVITAAQLMPADYEYAEQFKEIVNRAVVQ